jgi:glycosyltransferase involved in cell wall biosynthesis
MRQHGPRRRPGFCCHFRPQRAAVYWRTLASALAQTYDPIEVVVVDHGSIDDTATLVAAEVSRDDPIRLFRIKKSGSQRARNGIAKARGELIAPLDAGDLWHPQKLTRQADKIRASPAAVGLVYRRSR